MPKSLGNLKKSDQNKMRKLVYLHHLCAPHSAHVFNPLAVSANDLPCLTD